MRNVISRRTFATASGAAMIGLAARPALGLAMHGTPVAEAPGGERALLGQFYQLWSEHMQYTYQTVDAFFHDQNALQPYLDRLLRNQLDIGNVFAPYYGPDAARTVADLLTEHIELAVPVLQAAQAADDAALKTALDAWYVNAEAAGVALSGLNPDHWPPDVLRSFLRMHIDQTVIYAVALLNSDYAEAVRTYDEAHTHMLELPGILTDGIMAQFPERF